MCGSIQSLIRVDTNSFQGYKVKVHVTAGLIHGYISEPNELLGTEGETDVSFLKIRTKRLGEALWFQERFF